MEGPLVRLQCTCEIDMQCINNSLDLARFCMVAEQLTAREIVVVQGKEFRLRSCSWGQSTTLVVQCTITYRPWATRSARNGHGWSMRTGMYDVKVIARQEPGPQLITRCCIRICKISSASMETHFCHLV